MIADAAATAGLTRSSSDGSAAAPKQGPAGLGPAGRAKIGILIAAAGMVLAAALVARPDLVQKLWIMLLIRARPEPQGGEVSRSKARTRFQEREHRSLVAAAELDDI